MDKIKQLFALQQEVYDLFGYNGDLPLFDYTDYYWYINTHEQRMYFATDKANVINADNYVCTREGIHSTCIYKHGNYTMVDIRDLSNEEYLQIFDNSKEVIIDSTI